MTSDTSHERLFALLSAREIYIERYFRAGYAQVRAIDALTGIEVAVTTPANAAQHDQNRLVLRKLGQALIAQGHLADAARETPDDLNTPPQKGDNPKEASPFLPKGGIYT
ncbi:DUF6898 family protein [Candidatus Phycosocius spiralis]|uniref:DUF6898 domain-containing protein n=1 Tax=Candidatus Phycosocius spiralis TaxID=2815099 RepID=A0ABQ4PSI6_9PROT|nr:hypothetical protein [Candidatus Phycosocius spiralis]GIU65889.1 hypothetical protein PsB1_0043 [Candidatus Phycosocius spiralis]